MLPLTNASLTQIAGSGFQEDWDRPAGVDTVRWNGIADAYVTEAAITEMKENTQTEVKITRLVVGIDVGELVQRGDTVTYDWNNQTIQRLVDDVQTYVLFGTTRIWFKEE